MKKVLTLAALAAALAACTAPVGSQDSGIAAPSAWNWPWEKAAVPTTATPLATSDTMEVEHLWWKGLGDPVLERLIGSALANNKSLQIAEARVEEARANRRGNEASLLPNVVATGNASRENLGFSTNNKAIGIGEIDLQASWEVDLFGKNQARVAEAAAIVESEDARRQAVIVSLLADVARTYFDIRNYQEQIALTQKNLETQQRTLDLIKSQQVGALSSDLDVQRAAAQVSTTSAALPPLQSAYKVALNRLNVLLGTSPGTVDAWLTPGAPVVPLPTTVLVAAPAKVLASRPDIRSAERRFAASLSASDAAAREIYPTVSLIGLFGIQDSSLFSATPWGIAAGLAQPILNFGRIQSDIDVADARQRQAFLDYQQTVLEGLQDMEDALALYFYETSHQRDLNAAADQNRKAVDLADQQYRSGYTGLLDLLVAQRNELDAESSLASSDAQLRKSLVRIYTAAGGGWKLPTDTPLPVVGQTDGAAPAGG